MGTPETNEGAPAWEAMVAVVKVDHGGGCYVDATPEQLGVCGPGFQPVTVAELVPEPPVDEEGNALPVTPNTIAAALAERMSADKEAGTAQKAEAAAAAEEVLEQGKAAAAAAAAEAAAAPEASTAAAVAEGGDAEPDEASAKVCK